MNVVVGVDGSEHATDAVALALRLAAGGRLTIASVYVYDDTLAANREYREAVEAEAKLHVREVIRSLEVIGRTAATMVVAAASAAHGLHKIAAAEGADVVVVGSSHLGEHGRVFPGSTAERLLHGSPCPVAVAPSEYRHAAHPIHRIGVAVGGSPEAGAALQLAESLARAMHAAPPEELSGDTLDGLVSASEDLDLLVVGSPAYAPLRALLTDAITGKLLRTAACPLLAVPRGAHIVRDVRRIPQPA